MLRFELLGVVRAIGVSVHGGGLVGLGVDKSSDPPLDSRHPEGGVHGADIGIEEKAYFLEDVSADNAQSLIDRLTSGLLRVGTASGLQRNFSRSLYSTIQLSTLSWDKNCLRWVCRWHEQRAPFKLASTHLDLVRPQHGSLSE